MKNQSTLGWTPAARSAFLEALATCGTVTDAVVAVGLTPQSAYRLRARDPAFAIAWDAARCIARESIFDDLHNRAVHGWSEDVWYRGELVGARQRQDPQLLMRLLERLDRQAERTPAPIAQFDTVLAAETAGGDVHSALAPPRWQLEDDLCEAERWGQHGRVRHLRALLKTNPPAEADPEDERDDERDDECDAECDDEVDDAFGVECPSNENDDAVADGVTGLDNDPKFQAMVTTFAALEAARFGTQVQAGPLARPHAKPRRPA